MKNRIFIGILLIIAITLIYWYSNNQSNIENFQSTDINSILNGSNLVKTFESLCNFLKTCLFIFMTLLFCLCFTTF